MALVSAEVSREHDVRVWNEQHAYTHREYHNYVAPNLAPRPFETGELTGRPQRTTWREAPAPPPDPVGVVLQWLMQHPTAALVLAYALWLGYWSTHALQALNDF